MKKLITNNYNLLDSDITEIVRRVKVLIINSKNEILLGYSNHIYQFPGGHVKENETLLDAVNREIEEETGIRLNLTNISPFACAKGYYKDWPQKGKNRKTEIYYYEIKSNLLPNLKNVKYTKEEIEGNFELKYIQLSQIEKELKRNTELYGDEKGIAKEMLDLLKLYEEKR